MPSFGDLMKNLGLGEDEEKKKEDVMVAPPPEKPTFVNSDGDFEHASDADGAASMQRASDDAANRTYHGLSPEMQKATIAARNAHSLDGDPVMVPPPPETGKAQYIDQNGQKQPAQNIDSAKILADASDMLSKRSGRDKAASQFPFLASQGMFDEGRTPAPDPQLAPYAKQYLADETLTRTLGATDPSTILAQAGEALKRRAQKSTSEPPAKQGNDTGHADLMAAINKESNPPAAAAEAPAPAEGQHGAPNNAAAEAAMAPEAPAGAPAEGGGGVLQSLMSKMALGASDDRTQQLKDALSKSAEMKALANHITGMGIGADLVEGTHSHGDQGKGLRDQADDLVRSPILQSEFAQKNRKSDLDAAQEEQTAEERAQTMKVRDLGETRAEAAEGRAKRTSDITAAKSDKSSEASGAARASAQALYPTVWAKIPKDVRDSYSADDIDRIFKEVQMKDFAPKGSGKESPALTRQARALAARAKLPDPQAVMNINDVLATLDAGSAPGTGYMMNKGGWSNFIRSPDGIQFRQAVLGFANPYLQERAGRNVTAGETERVMGEMGYGSFDDPQSLASGVRRMAAGMSREQDQKLSQIGPEAKKMLEDGGAIQKIGGQYGTAIKGNKEVKYDDSFDLPTWLKPFIGAAGLAKEAAGNFGGGGNVSPQGQQALGELLKKMTEEFGNAAGTDDYKLHKAYVP